MASSINASTSGAGGVITTADNTGILNLQTASTTAVTIDASQNVGIGTTNIDGVFQVSRNIASSYVTQTLENTNSTGYTQQQFKIGTNGGSGQASVGYAPGLFFALGPTANDTTTPILFRNNNATERMRIDSSGNVGIGGTPTHRLYTTYATNADTIKFENTNGSFTSGLNIWSTSVAAGTSAYYVYAVANNVNTLQIFNNGNVRNTNGSYAAISDEKIKENIVDTTPKLDDLMKVRVRNYNLKKDLGYEYHKQIGVIAQELENVFPGLVEETQDRDAEGNNLDTTTKSVKYSVFVPILIKAIQEQQTIINDLKARVTVLEAK